MYFSFLFSTIHTCDSCLIQQYSIRPVVFGGGALVISAGLRSYMWVQRSSQWEQTDSWSHCNSNLVRDFQKCCVHSDVQIAALRRLCVQNFNASPKRGIKGPPLVMSFSLSGSRPSAQERGHTGQDRLPPPSLLGQSPTSLHPDSLRSGRSFSSRT